MVTTRDTRLRVLITDYMGDNTQLEEQILGSAGIETIVAPDKNPRTWLTDARNIDGILTRHAPITADTIRQLSQCRIISRYGTGTDNIDVGAAKVQGIQVAWVEGYSTSEVADHAWAMALALGRGLLRYHRNVARGNWQPSPLPSVHRFEGRTVGLIGFGRIGASLGARARASGMKVVAFDPYADLPADIRSAQSVEEVVESSFVISLHAPLTSETRQIINDDTLSGAQGALLINTSRGGLVDLDAALSALDQGRLAGLGLDVFEDEPLPTSSAVRNRPDVILSPHVAYYSIESLDEAKTRSTTAIVNTLIGS